MPLRRGLPLLCLTLGLAAGAGCAGSGAATGPVAVELAALWDFANPAASAARFEDAAESQQGLPRLEALTQLARAQGLQREFGAAFRTLGEVDAELERSWRDAAARERTASARALDRVEGRLLLERGRLQRDTGDAPAALESFAAALYEFLEAEDDALAVDAAHMAALAAEGEQRLAWDERALRMADSSSDPGARAWRASLHNNLGWEHFDNGAAEPALAHFERALELRAETGAEPARRIARWSVARCLRELGRVDEALLAQRALAADWRAAGAEDGYVYEELGHCLWALGLEGDAREPYGEAYRLLSADAWLVEHEPERLALLASRAAGGVSR